MSDLPSKEDATWRRTDEVRIVPIEGRTDFIGKVYENGLIVGGSVQRYRTERMWIRVWAEREWRSE